MCVNKGESSTERHFQSQPLFYAGRLGVLHNLASQPATEQGRLPPFVYTLPGLSWPAHCSDCSPQKLLKRAHLTRRSAHHIYVITRLIILQLYTTIHYSTPPKSQSLNTGNDDRARQSQLEYPVFGTRVSQIVWIPVQYTSYYSRNHSSCLDFALDCSGSRFTTRNEAQELMTKRDQTVNLQRVPL